MINFKLNLPVYFSADDCIILNNVFVIEFFDLSNLNYERKLPCLHIGTESSDKISYKQEFKATLQYQGFTYLICFSGWYTNQKRGPAHRLNKIGNFL